MKWLRWGALLVVACVGVAQAAPFSFGRPSHLTLIRNVAASVAIGDANGDGRRDLAVVNDLNTDAHQLFLYLQRADGTLGEPLVMDLPVEFGWASPVAFADLDGDGTDEVLVGTSQLLVVRAAGGVLTTVARGTAQYGCAYIATGDIDADGRTDVVCHSGLGTPTSSTLFYGDGTGGFRTAVDMLTDFGSYGSDPDFMSVRLADVSGDGRPDLVVTASRIDHFAVYLNDGLGGFFSTPVAYAHPPSATAPAALEVLDLDGDGVNEVVTATPDNQPNAMLNVYRQGAGGALALSQRLPLYSAPTALLAADVDDDGDQELLVGHFEFNAVTVLGAGGAGLATQARYDLPGFGDFVETARRIGTAKALAVGDLNGDGCEDLAAATYSGVEVLYGCHPFVPQVPVSDFDGDGVADLLWRQAATGENMLWPWGNHLAYQVATCWTSLGLPWYAQAVGDFDGDGTSDVFWRNTGTGANDLLLSSYFVRSITGVTDQAWQVVGAGDFDGDDHSDILWRNARTGAGTIWKSANPATQQGVRAVTDPNWAVAGIGDFNGDRRSDILWRNTKTGADAIWLSGRIETPQAITGVTDLAWKVVGIGDFNGDHRDDIVWRNTRTGAGTLWLSANSATQKGQPAVTNQDWTVGEVADYNADGVSDLMWRNVKTGQNVIWLSANAQTTRAIYPMGPSLQLIH